MTVKNIMKRDVRITAGTNRLLRCCLLLDCWTTQTWRIQTQGQTGDGRSDHHHLTETRIWARTASERRGVTRQLKRRTAFGLDLSTFTLAHIRWKPAHFRADTVSWNHIKRKGISKSCTEKLTHSDENHAFKVFFYHVLVPFFRWRRTYMKKMKLKVAFLKHFFILIFVNREQTKKGCLKKSIFVTWRILWVSS